jgi:hypothetical protein
MFSKHIVFTKNDNNIIELNNKFSYKKNLWYIWLSIAFSLFLLQASTIDVLPSLMQDEAQITDYGRLALDSVSRWSVTWWIAGDKPLFLWSYLGPLFAEISFQIGGSSGVGPRIMALSGGLVAGIIAFGWLLERKVPPILAAILAIIFLIDPLSTLSQRMARSDSWVIAFCLASCWILRLSSSRQGFSKRKLLILSGILAATASFVWPSAMFLYPLICLELYYSVYGLTETKNYWKDLIVDVSWFLFGGLCISIILIIPIRHQLVTIMVDMKHMVALNVNNTTTPIQRLMTLFSYQPWEKLIKAFAKTLSPSLPFLALWALVFRRERGLLLVAIITLSMIFMTLVYEFRILYLLPYLLAITGSLFQYLNLDLSKVIIKRISVTLLTLSLVWSIGITIFLRSTIAYHDRTLHDRSLITNATKKAIGPGNFKVFLAFTYELYFAGRSLGWQLYTPYIQFSYDSSGNWIRKDDFQPKDKFIKLMSTMDYAIFPVGKINNDMDKQLKLSGLNYKCTIHIGDNIATNNNALKTSRMHQIILWFLRGAERYGPYMLYARTNDNKEVLENIVRQKTIK